MRQISSLSSLPDFDNSVRSPQQSSRSRSAAAKSHHRLCRHHPSLHLGSMMLTTRFLACCFLFWVAILGRPSLAAPQAGPPRREELWRKSLDELKSILRSRGAKCRKCLEKKDFVDRVIETWEWSSMEASSPDGKFTVSKEDFLKTFEAGYRQHLIDVRARRRKEEEEETIGHQLAQDDEEDEDEQLPEAEIDRLWIQFSDRLRNGDIFPDDKGNLVYEYAPPREQAGWERYKPHLLLGVNLIILWLMHHVRRRERNTRKEDTQSIGAPLGEPQSQQQHHQRPALGVTNRNNGHGGGHDRGKKKGRGGKS